MSPEAQRKRRAGDDARPVSRAGQPIRAQHSWRVIGGRPIRGRAGTVADRFVRGDKLAKYQASSDQLVIFNETMRAMLPLVLNLGPTFLNSLFLVFLCRIKTFFVINFIFLILNILTGSPLLILTHTNECSRPEPEPESL